jgi:sortase A
MRDRRSVDDLTIEELEQILRIKKHQARQARLKRFTDAGRRRADLPLPDNASTEDIAGDLDDQQDGLSAPSAPGGAASWRERSLRDKLLLAVELTAALGLAGIMIFAATTLQRLNEESAAAQANNLASLPTATATPIISAVVLPSGHTPPTNSGEEPKPNYDEVPEYLRPIVEQQFAGPVIVPTPGPSHARRIRIPDIRVDAPVVQGDGWKQLMQGVGQHIGTANPGERGNVVLSAHNDIFGEIFRYLEELEEGDEIILETLTQTVRYEVVRIDYVEPTDVSAMESTNEAVVTLISCYPYRVDTQRIVVVAGLADQ